MTIRVGLIGEALERLEDVLAADERLEVEFIQPGADPLSAYVFDLSQVEPVIIDTPVQYEPLYRCVTEVGFYSHGWPEDCDFYVQLPRSEKLVRVIDARRGHRRPSEWILHLEGLRDPVEYRASATAYVCNRDVTGKTLDQVAEMR